MYCKFQAHILSFSGVPLPYHNQLFISAEVMGIEVAFRTQARLGSLWQEQGCVEEACGLGMDLRGVLKCQD